MNAKTKRRMAVVTGIIVIVLIVILAVVGGNGAAKSVTVAEAATGDYVDQKVQVSGNVVEDSYTTEDNVLTFRIYDTDGDPAEQLNVSYNGGVAATFGNDVTAICTGKIGSDGVLHASELVTKCPSKYENASSALSVADLLGYGESMQGKPMKVTGVVKAGTLAAAGQGDRFVLADADGAAEVAVLFDGALSEGIAEGTALVVTGALGDDGKIAATDVAIEG